MRFCWLTLTSLLCLACSLAASADAPAGAPESGGWGEWQEFKSLYDAGKYDEALHSLRSHPTQDTSFFYNLGTLHYRLGQLGIAVAYLEKANRLRPHDVDIQSNLNLARTGLGRLIGNERLDPASTWTESTADNIPLDEVRGTLGLLAFILTLFWTRAYLKCRNLRKTLLQPAGILGLLGFAISASLYGAQRLAESRPPAATLEPLIVRSGPGDQFLELAHVEAGAKLRLLGPTTMGAGAPPAASPPAGAPVPGAPGDPTSQQPPPSPPGGQELWRQVRYTSDGIGWVRASSLLLL